MSIFSRKKEFEKKLTEKKQVEISELIRTNVYFDKIPISSKSEFMETAVLAKLSTKRAGIFEKFLVAWRKYPWSLSFSLATIFSALISLILFLKLPLFTGNFKNSLDSNSTMIYQTEDGQVIIQKINYNHIDKNVKNL